MQQTVDSFIVSLRVNSQSVKLNLRLSDDQDSIFQRIVKICPRCSNRKEEVLDKLRKDLQLKIDGDSIKEEVRQAIKIFVGRVFPETKEEKKEEHSSVQKQNLMHIEEADQNKQYAGLINSQKKFESKDFSQSIPSCQQFKIKNPPDYIPKAKRQGFIKVQPNKTRAISENKKEKGNDDVVQACLLIFQKTNQNDMKDMAKRYLAEMGRLPKEDRRKEKVAVFKVQEKEEQKQVTQLEVIEKQDNQQPLQKEEELPRSPIQAVAITTEKKELSASHINEKYNFGSMFKSRESSCRRPRSNKYSYLASLQHSFLLSNPSYLVSDYKENIGCQRRFNYLSVLNN